MRILIASILAASLAGCITLQEAREDLAKAIAFVKKAAQTGAVGICEAYPFVAVPFRSASASGLINATTVRDGEVAIDILATNCPDILAGNPDATKIVISTYAKLMIAAEAARRR